jgi:Flp pilus assembly protein TadG
MNTCQIFCGRRGSKSGQTFVLFIFFLIILIVFVGLGIDLGLAYITRANLSKGIDAGCLRAMRSLSLGHATAEQIAKATFRANYGDPGWDIGVPTVNAHIAFDGANNIIVNMDASVQNRTYFIRALGALPIPGIPRWDTLPVSVSAQGLRPKLILSLVLDRSGSMRNNGGDDALSPSVSSFISLFDDSNDRAAMISFSSAARTDVTMRRPFINDIDTAADALSFAGWTCSERGLTNGLVEINTVSVVPGEEIVKVLVFFSDGMANTFYYRFNCGARNIASNSRELYNPSTGARANSGCSIPDPLTGLGGNPVDPDSCSQMHVEAEVRAERIAWLARNQGIIVYAIGLGDPSESGECGGVFPVLNPDFLKNLANTPDSDTFNSNQPVGDYAIAETAGELDDVFQQIADKILTRLTQ